MICHMCGEPIEAADLCIPMRGMDRAWHRKCWDEYCDERAAEETDLDAEASWREDVERENPPEGVW